VAAIVHSGSVTRDPEVTAGRRLVVARREMIAEDVARLTLTSGTGERLPAWMPGAHIDLTGPTGLTRQYSLCGDPDDVAAWQVAVLREPDGTGGSAAVHDKLAEGDTVTVSDPRNHFRLTDSPRYLFIAGGIGIAPIIPMIALVEREGRPWRLAYAGRTISSMAFCDELKRYGDKVTLHPSRERGRLDLDHVISDAEASAVFCCGPPGMIDAVSARCEADPLSQFRVERFVPVTDRDSAARGAAFTVELARSRQTLHVPDGQTIVEAMELAGLAPCSTCREGVCGACETRVLDGTPDHRDSVLEPGERDEGATMMICVSRAKTPKLVLDA
jgi:ferredoxin-NADP reductase